MCPGVSAPCRTATKQDSGGAGGAGGDGRGGGCGGGAGAGAGAHRTCTEKHTATW